MLGALQTPGLEPLREELARFGVLPYDIGRCHLGALESRPDLDGDSPQVVEIIVGGSAWRSRGLLGRLAARLSGDAVHVPWPEVDSV